MYLYGGHIFVRKLKRDQALSLHVGFEPLHCRLPIDPRVPIAFELIRSLKGCILEQRSTHTTSRLNILARVETLHMTGRWMGTTNCARAVNIYSLLLSAIEPRATAITKRMQLGTFVNYRLSSGSCELFPRYLV